MSIRKTKEQQSAIGRLIRFCLENKMVVYLFTILILAAGLLTAPFDWELGGLPRYPVPVDAIPDIGENQQIVFTEWMGRSPQDVEDQVTYPLTVSLLGIPEVKTVRSYSMFGFSTIYIIFKENAEFYWSRSRVLEKINSLPAGTLPEGVQPTLGPDATALGQIFWYTLEGRDPDGNPAGGWDLEELRTIQDWYVRYWLLAANGIAEVASVGGYQREYQIDVDPDAMRAYGVSLAEVSRAVKASNMDVGAKMIELNRAEYLIRGIGFIKEPADIENSVIKVNDNVPVLVKQVATVALGPALRRGALDKEGAQAVGGVVVARYGDNPLAAIKNVKAKIAEVAPALPEKTLPDGTVSKVTLVPFYDRTGLIYETLGTLNEAITLEVLITIVVVLIMVLHFSSGVLISGMLPLAVLLCFAAMKLFHVDANIVALSGIAIAIGTIVDMGIVICENILRHLNRAEPEESKIEVVHRAASEVGGAVLTAVLTTVVSFLPVFTMTGAEGKLFKPLAFTKTFALLASITIALTILPPLAHSFFRRKESPLAGRKSIREWAREHRAILICVAAVGILLTLKWEPLGPEKGNILNLLFVALLIGGLLGLFKLFQHFYTRILRWCLEHKLLFLLIPATIIILGFSAWRTLGKEFMPALDEGSFLYMPTTTANASIGEALDVLSKQDMAFAAIPEIDSVVGKLGRAETPLDPAPVSMIETVINYKPEYKTNKDGQRINFRYNRKTREFERDGNDDLIPDKGGRPYRQWREHIHSPDDIWNEIVKAGKIPGTTSAPKLQPIATRIVMLQSGMRAPMGVKVKGPSLDAIEQTGIEIERLLKQVPSVEAATVVADRIVGKPYLEIVPERTALARYGVPIQSFQKVIETAIGGIRLTTTVEGRERFPVRVRYQRELRDSIEEMQRILVPGSGGVQIPLTQLAEIRYVRGPQAIKSEDTFLIGYVVFDKKPGYAEVDVVEESQAFLQSKIESGELQIPAGVSYRFAGSYENQLRATKTLSIILPLALFVIFMIIYFQFRSAPVTLLVFSGIFVAWAGGFLLVWMYGQDGFLNFSLFGVSLRELFQVHPINMSVAVWVGFLALFGIATDNGVIQSTYLEQTFRERKPDTIDGIREATVNAAERRVRPCLMTSATTILALLPVLASTGRGSDVMVPMAIPSFGGMLVVMISIFMVPVLYCWLKERKVSK
ncbi:efflux RND transporter permease subunit [Verrucomicrobiota bacterium]